jgi:hypothetical protein
MTFFSPVASPSQIAKLILNRMGAASCGLICMTLNVVLAQSDEDLPDFHRIEVKYESRDYCGFAWMCEWSGGAHPTSGRQYLIVDVNDGGFVRPSDLIQPGKKDLLLHMLNVKLGLFVQELEGGVDFDASDEIRVLKQSSIEESHLDGLEFSNRGWSGKKAQLSASLTCNFLWHAARALEPYLTLSEEECLYFFRPELFVWQDID